MKKTIKISALLILILSLSYCDLKNCDTILCNSDDSFNFELVDKTSGENLFTNGTFNSNDIKIINLKNKSNIEFTFIDENDNNIISINQIRRTEIVICSIQISQENIFELFIHAEKNTGDCCETTHFKEIEIKNSEYQFDQNSGIYKILVP